MKKLFEYQENAMKELIDNTKKLLPKKNNKIIVFQSPTGSGKTFIITKYIENLINEINNDICFLWLSIGKGQLHKQSMKAVQEEISKEIECSLLEEEFFGTKNKINKNEIVFASWQKIKLKDNYTGKWKALVMKEKETINFIEVLENTRINNRKIILIIDESHAGTKTEKSIELINEIIKPNMTIEMSATPINDKSNANIIVNPTDVIEAGIIKKEIIINNEIDKIPTNNLDSQKLIILAAIQKREELKKLYEAENSNVNPLVLIQLPNSSIGNELKQEIEQLLKENNITEENKKLAIWLNDEKINNEYEKLKPNNSKVECLIFKQAIDTGWDCPRAQILIKFRETKNIVFEIQTVGRILRMPEAKHYNDERLNASYIYTNIKNIEVKKETYNPSIIKSQKSMVKKDYKPIKLLSYYNRRIDNGTIESDFIQIFIHTFLRYFMIDENKKRQNYKQNIEKFEKIGINKEFNKMDSLINNITINPTSLENQKTTNYNIINVEMSNIDLQANFDKIIKDNLNGYVPRKSLPTIKKAIYYTMNKYLKKETAKDGIIYIQKIIVNNKEIFSKIIDESIKDYKIINNNKINKNNDLWIDNWQIEETKNYNPNNYIEIKSKLSLYQPLYIELNSASKINEDELSFIKYLDKQNKIIEWFFVNGSEHSQKNFAIKTITNKSFQPNFIVKYKDGKIGIFDIKKTKSIPNSLKSNTLQKYIKEENKKGKKLFGGLIYKDNNNFKIYTKSNYIEYEKNPTEWEDIDNINK